MARLLCLPERVALLVQTPSAEPPRVWWRLHLLRVIHRDLDARTEGNPSELLSPET